MERNVNINMIKSAQRNNITSRAEIVFTYFLALGAMFILHHIISAGQNTGRASYILHKAKELYMRFFPSKTSQIGLYVSMPHTLGGR